jgi:hypothetical protein
LGDSITLIATPFGDNVFNGWLTYIDGEVLATLPINPFTFPASEANVNHTMLLIAQFAAAGAAPDSVTIIINVDNPLMGTTSPAPGTYRVAVGDPLDMVALPNAGFHNLYWIESATFMGTTFTDTLAYDTLNFFASPMMANATLNYTAYFEANPPVESTIDASEITYWVGTGSNQAVVAVNWSNGAYAWGVRFNGESITVQDALDSMAAYDYRFDYSADGYLNNITFDEGNLSDLATALQPADAEPQPQSQQQTLDQATIESLRMLPAAMRSFSQMMAAIQAQGIKAKVQMFDTGGEKGLRSQLKQADKMMSRYEGK